ncbi:MAG: hypothetical protein ACI4GO_02740 [Hominenteromicrobium sp.]
MSNNIIFQNKRLSAADRRSFRPAAQIRTALRPLPEQEEAAA